MVKLFLFFWRFMLVNNDDAINFNQMLLDGIFGLEPNDPKFSLSLLFNDSKRRSDTITHLWEEVFKDIQNGQSASLPLARIHVNLVQLQKNVEKLEFSINMKQKELLLLKQQIKLIELQLKDIKSDFNSLKERNDFIESLPKDLQVEAFDQLVKSRFQVTDNRGAGNCGFYSVSKFLFPSLDPQTEDDVIRQLRAGVVNYMGDNREKFEQFCTEDPTNHSKNVSFEEYLKVMSKSGTCISGQELRALSEILKRPIYLYTSGCTCVENNRLLPNINYRYGIQYTGEPITLYFKGAHYTTLKNK